MKKNYLGPVLLTVIAIAIIASVVVGNQNYLQLKKYMDAGELINQKKFEEAIAEFEKLNGFKNSEAKILEAYYEEGKYLLGERDFDGARAAFEKAGEHKDSVKKIKEVSIAEAKSLQKNKKFVEAANIFAELGEKEQSQKALFKYAKHLIEQNEIDKAREVLKGLEGLDGVEELLKSIEPTATPTVVPTATPTVEPDSTQLPEITDTKRP